MYVLRMICTNARMYVPGTRYIDYLECVLNIVCYGDFADIVRSLEECFENPRQNILQHFKITILRVSRTTLDLSLIHI